MFSAAWKNNTLQSKVFEVFCDFKNIDNMVVLNPWCDHGFYQFIIRDFVEFGREVSVWRDAVKQNRK